MTAVLSHAPVDAALSGWPHEFSPYHPGEQAVQSRAGVRERAELTGRKGIRAAMPEQHRDFFANLTFLLAGTLDETGQPQATILAGHRGFAHSPDPRTLRIDAWAAPDDPAATGLVAGAPVGLLGIQLETRRRNRMNGTIVATDREGLTVEVGQSFGNCPKYIQARAPRFVRPPGAPAPVRDVRVEGAVLSDQARAMIGAADTFFIATAAPGARTGSPVNGVDVSHRGGKPGFVRVAEVAGATELTLPDFAGNGMFNSFGNLALEPRAGLLFVDFASGDTLSLAATAEVIWEGPELASFAGAERLLRVRVTSGVRRADALPLRWSAPEASPFLARTGDWSAAAL